MAMINLGNIRFNWCGSYDNTISYDKDDVVEYKGSSYVAKKTVLGAIPTQGDDWDLMAAGSDQLMNKGDLLTHNGEVPDRIPIGDNAQILQVVDGKPAWRNQALDPSRSVAKLAKVNGMGGVSTRIYLMADGTIKACGSGDFFSNGDPSAGNRYLPSRVASEEFVKFTEVFLGAKSHYALTESGDVYSWGNNEYGQLGHGNQNNIAIAKRIDFFFNNKIKIKKVIIDGAGNYLRGVAYFLTEKGQIYSCGHNREGELGNGTEVNQSTPVRCGSLSDITELAVSSYPHFCYAIQSNGNLWVWGWNYCGQLGLGDSTSRNIPTLHPLIKNAKKAVCSSGYLANNQYPAGSGLVLLDDGTIFAAGCNDDGQLGTGDTVQRTSFSQIIHTSIFTDIIASNGRYTTCGAIDTNNQLWLWGNNSYGLQGTGNSTNQLSPQLPTAPFQGSVTKATFGGGVSYEGCIVQEGNTLWAAGYAGRFNLGTNSQAAENNLFKKIIGISGNICDWNVYGDGLADWGISVLYDDGRVDACGANATYGETGTQAGALHHVGVLTNVIF